jgi:hypothetical protein
LGVPNRRNDRDRPEFRARHYPDPLTLDYLLDWKSFAGWLREQGVIGARPTEREDDERQYTEILERYEAFKVQWFKRQVRKFFDIHAREEWMQEKYHVERAQERTEFILNMKKLLFTKFQGDLENGSFENVDLDALPVDETAMEADWDYAQRQAQASRTVSLRNVPITLRRAELVNVFQEMEGFVYLTLSEPRLPSYSPNDRQGFHVQHNVPPHLALGARAGWVVFESSEAAEKAANKCRELRDQHHPLVSELAVSMQNAASPKFRTLVSEVFSNKERQVVDLQKVKEIAERLDAESNINGVELIASRFMEIEGTTLLDKLIMYLRRVHLYCYYSGGMEAESLEELSWKCGDKIFRKPGEVDLTLEANINFLTKFDAKINQRFEPPSTLEALVEMGGSNTDTCVDDFLQKYVVKEQENRFRCEFTQCGKLFKDTVFVVKHIKNKHAADVANEVQMVQAHAELLNRFVADPHHLMPRDAQNMFNSTVPVRGPARPQRTVLPRSNQRDRRDSHGPSYDRNFHKYV